MYVVQRMYERLRGMLNIEGIPRGLLESIQDGNHYGRFE